MILEAKSLSFSYGHKERPVLRDLSLTISSGERVGAEGSQRPGKNYAVPFAGWVRTPPGGSGSFRRQASFRL